MPAIERQAADSRDSSHLSGSARATLICRAADPNKAGLLRMHASTGNPAEVGAQSNTVPLPITPDSRELPGCFLLVKRGHTQLLVNRVGLLFAHADAFAKIVQIDSFFTGIQIDTE